jgi:hypothetical protein
MTHQTQLNSLLLGEIQDLTSAVRSLLKTLRHSEKTWLEPREMAACLQVSTKTLQLWRISGRIKPESFRKGTRGYQFHREFTLRDAQKERS